MPANDRRLRVEIVDKPVYREVIVERELVRLRPPELFELLRRIRYDPRTHKVVYRNPDTRELTEILTIPDVAVDAVRPGKGHRDKTTALAGTYAVMDDANMQRLYESNMLAFFADVRRIALMLRTYERGKGEKLARLRAPTNTITS